MIEKFVCKFSNAKQWIEIFENECKRFEIEEDTTKIEILRLFLDKTCADWHSATLKTLKIEAGWSEWKNKFLDTFADKGWSSGMYAIFYKYKEGSLMEYAIRKEKLLLDMDENIGGKSLVTLIAAGLPEFIRNRIDPEKCETSTRLLHKISKCESLVNNKNFKIKKEEKDDNKKYSLGKKPCKTCQNLNKAQNEDLKILQRTKREINTMNAFEEIEEIKVNFNEHVNKNDFITNLHHLDNIKKSRIHNLIENYNTIFAKDKYDVGTVTGYEARIDLKVDKYCSKRPYRWTLEDKIEIVKQVGNLLKNNLIEESYSPFAAPVTLAFKRDENTKSRLCIDFRELNKIVIPQAQPFALISDLIVKARNCKYFTTLDINSAFWSIPLRIEDRQKTGFVTQDGHYQWTCLPIGLKTSPAIFQRILSNILRNNNLKDFTENYIDDILIFSQSFEEHIDHIEKVLKAIIKEGFRLKFKKCTFAATSVKYLGHRIGNNTVKPLKDNIISIRNFPTPKTRKNIRQFLGKINFYHEYIPNSSILLDPLHKLLRKDAQFIWSEECEETFSNIKNLLCSQPVLEIFDKDLPITIYTDASLNGIGAILKQIKKNGKEKPVGYFSKKLNDSQKREKAIYLECLAIKEAIKYWQYWLIGRKFTVFSDHKPLENLNIKARTDDELGDLTFYLSQYDFNIKYIPGKNNTEADSLSRNPVLEDNDNDEEILKTIPLVALEDKDQQRNTYTC
ncbi:unnamed protein product [Arctia plantaginis]|uniref:Reverse transcriptase domain-containing protein n=1 Tax=Arctia plantaginis TaxID=874455 RepID=A0A8S0ZDS6_ARCPL|nr:unnamed protein product [Arctia plantaginis]